MSRKPGPEVRAVRLPLGEDAVRPTFRRERAALKRGVWPVAGCDEAGRGPLAGPVVAAAVILDPGRVPRGLDDSKKLSPPMREKLYAVICASAHVAVAFAPPARIDRDNILRASLWALARAVAAFPSLRGSSWSTAATARASAHSEACRMLSRSMRAGGAKATATWALAQISA